ncbi:MAG: PLP-dependent transferase [Bacteroidia bacterium]|nr:PLP-dependent transferase [Bacteroidia bacterium]
MAKKPFHPDTLAIRIQTDRSQHREHATPLFNTSSFVFNDAEQMRALFADEEDGHIYSRYSNPNGKEFEDKMAALEGMEDGFATASGMAAVFASMAAVLSHGDHVVASRALFGASHSILTNIMPRFGISHTYVDPAEGESVWEAAIQPNTKMIFAETPSNPGLALVDLTMLGKLASKHDLMFNVDNCFATPYLQNPGAFGAHLVSHSATKFIDGQGRVLGGIVVGSAELVGKVRAFCRATGPAIAPFNAWILSKSLETLHVRMDRHCSNALALATWLETRSDILRVNYPFLPSHPQHDLAKKQMRQGGGVVTCEVAGGIARGREFLNHLEMISLSANLGDSRSIATHPASTTHAKLSEEQRQAVGITPGLVRISVGLEHISDIIADVEAALDHTKS